MRTVLTGVVAHVQRMAMAVSIALTSHAAHSATPAEIDAMRENALAYLFSNQDADGFWDGPGKTDIRATSLVLHAFAASGVNQGLNRQAALSWLANAHPHSVTAMGAQAGALGQAGMDVANQLAELAGATNGYYAAWGAYPGYQPSLPDTAIAHDAWFLASIASPNAATTTTYVRNTAQNADGGWPYMAKTLVGAVSASSQLIPTAHAVMTLSRSFQLGQGSQTDITEGVNWLLGQQLGDGGFADDSTVTVGEAYETALVMRAIKVAQAAGNSTALGATAAVDTAADFLIANQALNGAWNDDVMATAAVVDGLANVTLPDGDGDGIPDTVEPLVGTDALVADASTLLGGIGDAVAGLNTAETLLSVNGGEELSHFLPASGTPVLFRVRSGILPPGIALNAATGELTGMAIDSGAYHIEYSVELDDGSEEQGVITLEVEGVMEENVPMMNLWFMALLALLFGAMARYRRLRQSVVSIGTFAVVASLLLGTDMAQAKEPLPERTARQITDQYVGHPGERDESVRSISEHVNAISIALDEDHSIEARKMFAKNHGAALRTLNQQLNDELTGKRARRYLREGDAGIALSADEIRAKDASVNDFLSDIDGLLSLDGEEALEAFLRIRKRLHRYEDEYFSPQVSPNWTHGGDPGEALELPASKSVPAYLAMDQRDWALRSYAFNGDGFLLAAAPSTPSEATTCSYTAADLADDGADITLTQAIHDQAEALDYSPIRIFEFVANEIEFQPYYGAMKGADATLRSESGSATDQSSLLIALLRASNIPARYVRGDIDADIGTATEKDSRIVKWLQVETLEAAAVRLGLNGNPAAGYAPNDFMRFSHVWVEACVPYAHYQGARFDQAGHRWVPLDPSFEVRTYKDELTSSTTFDLDVYLDGFKVRMPEEEYESLVNAAVTDTDKDVNDVGYRSTKHKLEIDILPASLPYNVRQFTNWSNSGTPEAATLPDSHRYFLHIDTKNSADVDLGASISVPMYQAVLDRVSLFYQGATPAHETAMQNWRLNGGTAPTTLDLVPVIRIDGVDQATGTVSVKSNTTNNKMDMRVTMEEYRFSRDNKDDCPTVSGTQLINDACFDTIRAANFHSVQAWAYQGTRNILSSMADELVTYVNANAQFGGDIENTLGRFLHYISLGYMTDISEASHRIGQLTDNTGDNGIHLGVTGSQSYVDKVLDIPFGILKTGFYVDVPGGQSLSQTLDDGTLDFDAFLVSGYASSAYESQEWQEAARLDAISTIRGIQLSEEQGFDVLTINSGNQATELPKLIAVDNGNSGTAAYPAGFLNTLETNYLDEGFEIKIPDRRINYEGWEGYTLVGAKNSGGVASATFPISGDYAGGYTVSNPITYNYDPFSIYDTGYFGGNTTSILNGGSVSGGSTSSFDLNPAIFQSDYGAIGNGGGSTNTFAGDPVNLVTGNFYHTERDLVIPHRDLPFVFERVYNSREPKDGPLGFGWTHSFNHALNFVDEVPDNVENASDTDGTTSSIIWTDGTGGEKRVEVGGAAAGGVTGATTFTLREGQYFTFVREADGSFTVTEKNGLVYRFEISAGDVDDVARLTQIESRNGNMLTLTYDVDGLDRVTDTTGRFIDVTYTSGRISRVEDWTGRGHEYEYDANGNLDTYKNPLAIAGSQNPVTYDYFTAADSSTIDHAIKSITLPKGNGMTFEYYVDGRVASHTNTAGETFRFLYNDFRRETVVTDARGFSKRYFFNEYGNPVEIVDEEGGISTYEYTDPNDSYLRTAMVNEARLRTEYEYNANGTLILQRNPSGSTVEYSDFTAFEQPGKIKDANGNYTLLQYDADGNVTNEYRMKAGVGASLVPASYVAVANDLLSWVQHGYDSAGNRTSSTQVRDVPTVEGFKQQWTFDANQLYATQFERCGDKNGDGVIDGTNDPCDVASLTYDSLGRLEAGVNGRFEAVEYRYDELNRVVRGTDALGYIRDYGFDDNGNADYQGLSVRQIAHLTFSDQIDPTSSNDPLTLVDSSSSHFDESDRQRIAIDAGGHATYFSYDPMGNVETVTNPDNYVIRFAYDGLGRVTSAFDEEGREAKRDIDPIGRMRSLTDPNGNSETFTYYGAANDGRMEKQCETPATFGAVARCTTFAYDSNGNVTTLTDNAGNTTLTTYDALNRPVRIVEPSYTDPVHGVVRPVTHYSYNLLGHVTQVQAGYNTDSVLALPINDVLLPQQTRVHDDWGRKLSDTDPLGQVFEYEYNLHGDLVVERVPTITLTSAIGSDNVGTVDIVRSYSYGGLITQEDNVSYKRNALGLITEVSGANEGPSDATIGHSNAYEYQYDSAHRLQRAVGGGVTFDYTLSPGGLLEKVDVSRGNQTDTIAYRYDKTGRLQSISDNDSEHVGYVFDDGGRLRQKTYPGGVTTAYDYFDDDRLKQLLVKGPTASTLLQQDFTYDNRGRRDGLTENLNGTATTSSYAYDNLSRLTSETLGAQTQSWTYDAYGNRVTHTQFDTSVDYYEHDAAHQLKTVRDTNAAGTITARYQYTPAGELFRACEGNSAPNVTADELIRGECDLRDYTFYEHNRYGQLDYIGSYSIPGVAPYTHYVFQNETAIPDIEQFNTSQEYDYQGRRVEVSGFSRYGLGDVNGAFNWIDTNKDPHNTQYRYNGEAIYLSYQTGQSVANPGARYLQGPGVDEPLIRYGNDASITNYHQDGRNSVVLTTEAAGGAVIASQQFDAFGNASQTTGTIAQYGYTGREPVVNGMLYYRARHYDPRTGRFASRDPRGFIDGVNRYAYTRNNPINNIDPSGTVSLSTNNYSSLNNNYFSGGSSGISSQTLFDTNSVFDSNATAELTHSIGGDASFLSDLTGRIGNFSSDVYDFADSVIDFNPTKLVAGAVNGANAVRLGIQSRALALVSAFSFGIGQPEIGVPAAALSVFKAGSAVSASKRGGQQIGEAFAEDLGNATSRNLLGVLPFGQHFDDPSEPLPHQFDFSDIGLKDVLFEAGTILP